MYRPGASGEMAPPTTAEDASDSSGLLLGHHKGKDTTKPCAKGNE